MLRKCTDCQRDLPESNYYWVSKASRKLRGQCKECMRTRKLEQRDPAWTPACSRCGQRLTVRAGSGRRLCNRRFGETYDTEHRRSNGAHRIRLRPCTLCGGEKERFERGKVCVACRPWLKYAASLRSFGLTPAEYVAIFRAQGGVCYVCGTPPAKTRLCIDHDHTVPVVRDSIRGLLCDDCNYSRLPRFREDVTMLRRAVDYLTDPPAQRVLGSLPSGLPAPPPPQGLVFFDETNGADETTSPTVGAGIATEPELTTRPGSPPVGSQRRPSTHGTSARSTGRSSGARRREQAGEADH
jgi:Recombination endonuclease VII